MPRPRKLTAAEKIGCCAAAILLPSLFVLAIVPLGLRSGYMSKDFCLGVLVVMGISWLVTAASAVSINGSASVYD